jgi:hypothetical protein
LKKVALAKAYCTFCRVRDECLDNALLKQEKHGIWGGLTDSERLNYLANSFLKTGGIGLSERRNKQREQERLDYAFPSSQQYTSAPTNHTLQVLSFDFEVQVASAVTGIELSGLLSLVEQTFYPRQNLFEDLLQNLRIL